MFQVAIVGSGGMGSAHAGCYAAIDNATVVGAMDIRLEAAQSLAARHNAKAYTDFNRMLDELRPDIVDICVPTPWHAEYVCLAAEAELKGIVCEKPMARTIADCDRMISACEQTNTPLFIAHVLRFFPEFIRAKELVDAGAVGQPVTVRTRRGGPFPHAWSDWYANYEWSGSLVLDMIIHDFDWLRWTFGEVERVMAKSVYGKNISELDYALVTLRFKSGVMAHVEGTWADPSGFKVSFEIAGDKGILDYNFNQPTSPPFQIAQKVTKAQGVGVAVPESPLAISPYQAELSHFLSCLEQGVTPSVTPADAKAAVVISLAALSSMEAERPVRISELVS